jgi:hypothetical protein
VRELTEYEKQKWFDDIGRFEAPEFVMHGDELGEAYDSLVFAEDHGTYIDDEIVAAIRIGILDMYYYQMIDLYCQDWGADDPEDLGLPSQEAFKMKWDLITPNSRITDEMREIWDWAMDWREEHKDDTYKRLRAERLRQELERLER